MSSDSSHSQGSQPASPASPEAAESLRLPLRFKRVFVEKPWGGRALEKVLGIELPGSEKIGETWELVDRESRSSEISEGPLQGRRLSGLMLSEREALLGKAKATRDDAFPLLIKYLSAEDELSVQVHPDDEAALKLGTGDGGKNEFWYILDAKPGARIYLGLREGIDATHFAEAATSAAVCEMLESFEVEAGQYVMVPAGTVHAVGAGITLLEVQQNSDLTYRIHDWGRTNSKGEARETHLEQALYAIDYETVVLGPQVPAFETAAGSTNRRASLADCETFEIELSDLTERAEGDTAGRPEVLCVVHGSGELRLDGDADDVFYSLERGDVLLLPAAVGRYSIEPKAADLGLLRTRAKS